MEVNKSIKFSVIIPVYNVAPYLRKCLDSVIYQTYDNIEILVINDGSTDDSLAICKEYADKDERILIFTKPNGGQSSARNLGLDKMTGDYAVFLDGDDFLNKESCYLLAEILSEHRDADIVEFPFIVTSEHDIGEPKLVLPPIREVKNPFARYIHGHLAGSVWCRCYAKKILSDARFPEGRVYEEQPFLFKALNNCNHYYYAQGLNIYHYVRHEGSTSFQLKETIVDVFRNIDDLRNEKLQNNPEQVLSVNTLMVTTLMFTCLQIYKLSDKRDALLALCYPFIRRYRNLPYESLNKTARMKRYLFMNFPRLYLCLIGVLDKVRKI